MQLQSILLTTILLMVIFIYIAKLAAFAQALPVTAYMVASYYFDFSNKQLADRKLGDGQLVRLGID